MRKLISAVLAATLMLAVLPAVSLGADTGLNEGLVLRYTFDTDGDSPSSITDVTGNGFDGQVLNNQYQSFRPGGQQTVTKEITVENGVAVFPGGESVRQGRNNVYVNGAAIRIPDSVKERVTGSYTVTMWVKPDSSYGYWDRMQRFFDFGGTNNSDSIFLRYEGSAGKLRFQDRAIASGKDDPNSFVETQSGAVADTWTLLAVTYDAAAKRAAVYINDQGEAAGKDGFTRTVGDIGNSDAYGMFLGRTQWYDNPDEGTKADNPEYKGLMDDVRLYGRTLTADEITELYNTTNPAAEKVVVEALPVDDVYTLAGIAPSLPSKVRVNYSNSSSGEEEAVWDEVPAESYASAGSFTVKGYVKDTDIEVKVTVIVTDDPKATLNSGMIANYTFDTDGQRPDTVKDMSGNGNDAAVENSMGWMGDRALTIQNGAAVFPGFGNMFGMTMTGAALKLPDNFNQGLDDWSISMWVNADTSYDYYDGYDQRLFDFGNRGDGDQTKDDTCLDSIFFKYNVSNGYFALCDRKQGRDEYGSKDNPDNYFAGKWGMLTVTYSKADQTMTAYINDGEKNISAPGMLRGLGDLGDTSGAANGLYIGRNQWYDHRDQQGINPDFKGKMDNIRIYGRTLSAEEVEALYDVSNPFRKITVTKNTIVQDADGNELHRETVTEEAAEGTYCSMEAERTLTYDGTVYTLSQALSNLSIPSVDDGHCTMNAVYTILKVESVDSPSVETYKGREPQFPEYVNVAYQTGDTASVLVEWEYISPEKYAARGEFDVNGVMDGGAVAAHVTVYEVTKVELAQTVYAPLGEGMPSLPATAQVTFSNRSEPLAEYITWDELPADKVEKGESFTLGGRLTDYPDVALSVEVEFILEAAVSVSAVADTYTTDGSKNSNFGSDGDLRVNSTGGVGAAGTNRYTFLRFPGGDENVLGAKVKVYVDYIDNPAYVTYTLHAIAPENNNWDERYVTWNNQDDLLNNSTEVAKAGLDSTATNVWLEFDISDYIMKNPGQDYYSFYISSDTSATYLYSREYGVNPPTVSYYYGGQRVSINYVNGAETLLTETAVARTGKPFDYADRRDLLVNNGRVYEYRSGGHIDIVDESNNTVTIEVEETDSYSFDSVTVSCYYDEEPVLPTQATLRTDRYMAVLPVTFEAEIPGDYGTYVVYGDAQGLEVSATVKAYGRYYSKTGALLGYASRVAVRYSDPAAGYKANDVELEVRTGTVPDEETFIGYYPQLRNEKIVSGGGQVTEPEHTVSVEGELYEGLSAEYSAELVGDDPSLYSISVSAVAANTDDENRAVSLVIARYDADGRLVETQTEKKTLLPGMKNRAEFDMNVTGYDRAEGEDVRIYVWEHGTARPLGEVIAASDLPDPSRYSDSIMALIPDYGTVKENVIRANDYRQRTWRYDQVVNGIDIAFWDTAAYHTGNMEAYFTFGEEDYLNYSLNWGNSANWKGNNYGGSPDRWTWGYNQGQGSNAVLFGDWQICFQSYLDMYMLDPSRANIDRAREVMSYQITKDNDDFWWWADSLYMVTPVMTKMYLTTGDETYLDKLYEYYKFAAELMYDGECGIPNEGEEYTTSAGEYKENYRKGGDLSDPNNYANLFYRDGDYVYPQNPNPGHDGEKNFWARGNGWVFAGLAKILTDLPESHESYSYFVNLYKEMAASIIACQMQDDEGRGFWTQSMLQDYPKGQNGNDWGYETSGTAFFTYGLFWGLNSGLLDEDTYLEPALRAWKYLSEVALQDDGKVGYVQAIGSNATQATPQYADQPFGYGAFLLAGCEASRWAGGVEENNEPYLRRKLWGSVAYNDSMMYAGGQAAAVKYGEDGTLYLPVNKAVKQFGYTVGGSESEFTVVHNGETSPLPGAFIGTDADGGEEIYASPEILADALGLNVIEQNGVNFITHHSERIFYGDEANSVDLLKTLLTPGE